MVVFRWILWCLGFGGFGFSGICWLGLFGTLWFSVVVWWRFDLVFGGIASAVGFAVGVCPYRLLVLADWWVDLGGVRLALGLVWLYVVLVFGSGVYSSAWLDSGFGCGLHFGWFLCSFGFDDAFDDCWILVFGGSLCGCGLDASDVLFCL